MVMCWGCSEAIIGYDCGSKILNMTTISLVDIDECDIEEDRVETSLPDIALLQLNEYQHTKTIQCKIEIRRVIQHCGWQSYNSIVSQGINEYIYPISRELCQVAHDHKTLRIGNTFIDGLEVNTTTVRSISLAGSVNSNADCTNSQYSDPFGTWNNVFVIGTAKITLKVQSIRVKVSENKVYFPSGHQCNLDKGNCIDPEYGYLYWNSLPQRFCITNTYSVLFKGFATSLKSKTETVYSMNVKDTSFSLNTIGAETSCGVTIIRTEHPKLFIVTNEDLESLEKTNIVQSDPDNLDIFMYTNAKFVYVERYIRSQVQSLYLDVMKNKCKLEEEILKNTLSIASTQPDEFAFRYMEGSGYMAVVAGEVIHIVQCVPVEVKVQQLDKCYNRMPVQRGNQSMFLTPRTHVLTNLATELPCNSPLLQIYKLGTIWYKFMPRPVEALPPKTLKPSTKMTWTYQNPANLAVGGIYTENDLDATRGRIMFTMEQSAVLETVAQQIIKDSQGSPSIFNAFNEDVLDKLAESAWSRTWGKFTGFGTYCAGIIGIVMCLRIIKLVADTVIHGYALHTVYGWSICLVGALWDSFTHLLLHLGNQKRRQEETSSIKRSTSENNVERKETSPTAPVGYPCLTNATMRVDPTDSSTTEPKKGVFV
ncbi:uncharacterized protein LOC141537176 [Cotesia typhae]|uniref:uncharacterized protein LOC141537176 n=1 Tax=Cotesia typhae TaxID=2053667 RepID=UPI003D68A02A